jgi:hypothetical protein
MRIMGDMRRFLSGKNTAQIFDVDGDGDAAEELSSRHTRRPLLLLAKRFQEDVVRSWNSTVADLTPLFILPMCPIDEGSVLGTGV